MAIAGDHDPVAVLDRGWATAAQASTTVHDFLTAVGRTLRPAITRSAGLVLAAYGAAETDPRYANSPASSPPSVQTPSPGPSTASATAPPSARESPAATQSTRYGCSWTPPSPTT